MNAKKKDDETPAADEAAEQAQADAKQAEDEAVDEILEMDTFGGPVRGGGGGPKSIFALPHESVGEQLERAIDETQKQVDKLKQIREKLSDESLAREAVSLIDLLRNAGIYI